MKRLLKRLWRTDDDSRHAHDSWLDRMANEDAEARFHERMGVPEAPKVEADKLTPAKPNNGFPHRISYVVDLDSIYGWSSLGALQLYRCRRILAARPAGHIHLIASKADWEPDKQVFIGVYSSSMSDAERRHILADFPPRQVDLAAMTQYWQGETKPIVIATE